MSTSGKVRLTVTARDRAAEIFVIDSKLDRVDRGIGSVITHQPPGVYKLKVRAGQATHEELVVLEKAPVVRVLDHLSIPSAVPLDQTAQSHEYHQEAALRESATPRVRLGDGSSIFIFARDWTPAGRAAGAGHHPAERLELCSAEGAPLVDLQQASAADLERDPWAACRVEVVPGFYRLRVTSDTGSRFESAVMAHRGWQTQVFLLQRRSPISPRAPPAGPGGSLGGDDPVAPVPAGSRGHPAGGVGQAGAGGLPHGAQPGIEPDTAREV